MGSIPGLSSLSDETLNRGPMTIVKDKLLTIICCDKAGDFAVPNVFMSTGHKLDHQRVTGIVTGTGTRTTEVTTIALGTSCSRAKKQVVLCLGSF